MQIFFDAVATAADICATLLMIIAIILAMTFIGLILSRRRPLLPRRPAHEPHSRRLS